MTITRKKKFMGRAFAWLLSFGCVALLCVLSALQQGSNSARFSHDRIKYSRNLIVSFYVQLFCGL